MDAGSDTGLFEDQAERRRRADGGKTGLSRAPDLCGASQGGRVLGLGKPKG